MASRCEVCGNDYDKPMEIRLGGRTHVFDSFECAVQALAPTCARCQCRILGHGTQAGQVMYCGAHCAAAAGVVGMTDRT